MPIQRAAAEINHRLAADQEAESESRDGRERVLIVGPLTVVFEAFADSPHGPDLFARPVSGTATLTVAATVPPATNPTAASVG